MRMARWCRRQPEVDEFLWVCIWFALEGDACDVGRDVTGLANLAFLFLLASAFIWLLRVWSAAMLTQLLFARRPPTAKARTTTGIT